MKCWNCGIEIDAKIKYCPKCGQAIRSYKITDKRGIEQNQVPNSILKDKPQKSPYNELLVYVSLILSIVFIFDWVVNMKFSVFSTVDVPSSLRTFRVIFGVLGFCLGWLITIDLFMKVFNENFIGWFIGFWVAGMLGMASGIIAAIIGPFVIVMGYKVIRILWNG